MSILMPRSRTPSPCRSSSPATNLSPFRDEISVDARSVSSAGSSDAAPTSEMEMEVQVCASEDNNCSLSNEETPSSLPEEKVAAADTSQFNVTTTEREPPRFFALDRAVGELCSWPCSVQACPYRTVIWPMCQQHAKTKLGLKICPSGIDPSFHGLFAWDDSYHVLQSQMNQPGNWPAPVVFASGQLIAQYIVQRVSPEEFHRRYLGPGQTEKDCLGPYAFDQRSLENPKKQQQEKQECFFDGALTRSYATFVNCASDEDSPTCNALAVASKNSEVQFPCPGSVEEKRHVNIIAKRNIVHGEEILFYYSKSYSKSGFETNHRTEWLGWLD